MAEYFIDYIANHWLVSIYFGTMIFNENAILAAFSLSVNGDIGRYAGVTLAAIAGTLTNDLIIFAVTRYWKKYFAKEKYNKKEATTIFEKIFFKNIFLSLLFIKFFFGMRIILTVYLIAKKELSLKKYLRYNICGIFFYVFVLGVIGWLIGKGVNDISGSYHKMAGIITGIAIVTLSMRFLNPVQRLRRYYKTVERKRGPDSFSIRN